MLLILIFLVPITAVFLLARDDEDNDVDDSLSFGQELFLLMAIG
jgi:hypothetical protein